MTGDAVLERTIRAHANTLEWLSIFLPSLWLFAFYWSDTAAALAGILWMAGRLVYFLGYVSEAARRRLGFFIQAFAAAFLLFGALARAGYLLFLHH